MIVKYKKKINIGATKESFKTVSFHVSKLSCFTNPPLPGTAKVIKAIGEKIIANQRPTVLPTISNATDKNIPANVKLTKASNKKTPT